MGAHDWYRNTSWDPNIAAAFNARIARSRQPWSKWQYFHCQAGMLAVRGYVDEALQLYERSLIEVKNIEPDWKRHSLGSIGRLLLKQGKLDEAKAALEAAVEACSLDDAHLRTTDEDEPEAVLRRMLSSTT